MAQVHLLGSPMIRMFFSLCAGAVGCAFALQFPATAIAKGKETVLHSFGSGGSDGRYPQADLIDVKGTLYGTTEVGGSYGNGSVFSVNPTTGAETVVYSFAGDPDGYLPVARVIDVKGTLYGTTGYGGGVNDTYCESGCGTVFSLDPKTGTETVLHAFGNGTDGEIPVAGLIDVRGVLYGTTKEGGAGGSGTVFSVNPTTGSETVVYSFCGQQNCTDGVYPQAGLIDVKGTLYGTTELGGSHGYGTVFSVNPTTGAEAVVYSFAGDPDGYIPVGSVMDVKGTLYGTTENGGSYNDGTVFALDLSSGAETVLHSFGSGSDGDYPNASLIHVGGVLYSTTKAGGTYGDGTVFSFKLKTGAETVVYSFAGGTDGGGPLASLVDVKGSLYGTTDLGGTYDYGTVFAIKKP